MKYLLSIFILLIAGFGAKAQSSNYFTKRAKHAVIIPLDSAYMSFIYHYRVHDPVLDEVREDFKLLSIGKNLSMYSDYASFQIDSLIAIDYPDGTTGEEYHKLASVYHPSWGATVKDQKSGRITTYDRVLTENYTYEETINPMTWALAPGSETICGYKCRKATTSFRGRKWTAWYAPEIPIDNGPWKFGGLPGLILKAESEDGDQKFEAVSIRNDSHVIGFHKRNYQKTTREKYNSEFKEYRTRPRQFHVANPKMAPKDKDGNIATPEFSRLFFNPIELE